MANHHPLLEATMLAARCCLIATIALAACAAPQGDLNVSIPPHIASAGPSALASAPPRNVAIPPFRDATARPGRIGDRSTSASGPTGAVIIDPPPGQLLHDAFAAELRRAGHTIASSAGATIEGSVVGFTLRINSTAMDWQVIVDANVAIAAHTDERTVNHAYATRCEDRSYTTPGASVIAGMVGHCIDDLARQFRSDADIAQVLGAP
jgi:uncharacterized lipoprotein YajG